MKVIIVVTITFFLIGCLVYSFIKKLKAPNIAWARETRGKSKKEKLKILLYGLGTATVATIIMFIISLFNVYD